MLSTLLAIKMVSNVHLIYCKADFMKKRKKEKNGGLRGPSGTTFCPPPAVCRKWIFDTIYTSSRHHTHIKKIKLHSLTLFLQTPIVEQNL